MTSTATSSAAGLSECQLRIAPNSRNGSGRMKIARLTESKLPARLCRRPFHWLFWPNHQANTRRQVRAVKRAGLRRISLTDGQP